MNEIQSYKDLKVWQKGIVIVKEVYRFCESMPKSEQFGLTCQMTRSTVSVPSNIAEGHGRSYTKNFTQFLKIARGSLLELENQVIIGTELEMITK